MTWPPPAALPYFHAVAFTPNTNNKENTTMSIRNALINVLQEAFDFETSDINTVLDACCLEEIVEAVDVVATYTVTVTYCAVPVGNRDVDDLDQYDLANMLDDEQLFISVDDADDIAFETAEVG